MEFMAIYLYSIDEAVDRKLIVTKSISGQAKAGTLVHIMDCIPKGNGGFTVCYRITETGQDFTMDFDTLKQFCKWAIIDDFIARHYENLQEKDIMHYIKITSRGFIDFYLPILIAAIVIIWLIMILAVKGVAGIILAVVLSIAAATGTFFYYKYQKKQIVLYIYSKVGQNSWGVIIK